MEVRKMVSQAKYTMMVILYMYAQAASVEIQHLPKYFKVWTVIIKSGHCSLENSAINHVELRWMCGFFLRKNRSLVYPKTNILFSNVKSTSDFGIYFFSISDLNAFLWVSYIIGLILFLITITKFILFIPNILQNTPKRYVSRTLLLCSIYTIVAASSLTSMLVPRALLFCESISVITFALCSYQFFWYTTSLNRQDDRR